MRIKGKNRKQTSDLGLRASENLWLDKDGNLKKKNLRILLIIILFTIIAVLFSFNKLTSEPVEAQVSFGYQCQNNYAKCANGTNVMEALDNGTIKVYGKLTISDVKAAIAKYYGALGGKTDISNNLCLNTSNASLNIIPFYINGGGDNRCEQSDDERSSFQDANAQLYIRCDDVPGAGIVPDDLVARVCASNLEPQNSQMNGFDSWGCCPKGSQFVTSNQGAARPSNINQGACCTIPSGAKKGGPGYPHYHDGTQCKDINNNNTNAGISLPFKSDAIYGSYLGYNREACTGGRVAQYCIPQNRSNNEFTPGTSPGAPKKCASISKCAIDGSGKIVDPSIFLNSGSKDVCSKCFDQNAPIRVDDKNLYLCDNAKEKAVALINGNIADTLAWLASDPENRDDLRQCRERGGIYIAIGCIDTTPIGIITGLIRIAFGVMGGVALVQLIIAGVYYQMGDEAKIKEARDKVIATLTGIAVLVFSVLILRIIGINVLDILPPGSI